MSRRLEGKIAVVSGIANGIGKDVALRFAAEGALVVGTDIDGPRAKETAAEAQAAGGEIRVKAPLDMFDEGTVVAFMDEVGREHGRIDILINAAAVVEFGWIEDLTAAQFRRTMVGEVDSVFLACKAAWPHLKVNGGAIVNFASVAAKMAVDALAGIAHCAGKGAVLAMTRQIALEGAKHGIRANTVSPGIVVTPATEPALEAVPGFADAVRRKLMLGRYGTPTDVAAACLFLASDEASWITAAELPIDGGMTAW